MVLILYLKGYTMDTDGHRSELFEVVPFGFSWVSKTIRSRTYSDRIIENEWAN